MIVKQAILGLEAPNYTQIPNIILDNIKEFSGAELAIIMAICRLTFGWHVKKTQLSICQLSKMTGLGKTCLLASIVKLHSKGIINRDTSVEPHSYSLTINEFPPNYRMQVVQKVNHRGSESEPPLVQKVNHRGSESEPPLVQKVNHEEGHHIYVKERKEIKERKAASSQSSDHQIFIQLFCELYLERTGKKYIFEKGKDGKAVQWLLANTNLSAKELIGMLREVWDLAGKDKWLSDCGTSISKFRSQFNVLQAKINPAESFSLGPKERWDSSDYYGPKNL